MGKGVVGKSVNNHELTAKMRQGIIAVLLLLVQLLWVPESRAFSEFELFDRGYEYYLAYQPGLAADTFNLFLSEFPQSSAGDAALFWLGKSLIRVKSPDEARRVFVRLKKEFPESPLVPYAERELGDLGNTPSPDGTGGGLARGEAVREPGRADSKKEVQLVEHKPVKTVQEGEKLTALLQEEQAKNAAMKAKVMELEKRDADNRALFAKGEAEQKSIAAEMERDRRQLRDEREKLDAERRSMTQEPQKAGPEENRREEGEMARRGYEVPAVKIRGEMYTTLQVINFMLSSSSAMVKVGIRDVPWRSGDLFDDFVNEQVLYSEARRVKVNADAARVNELAIKFKLDADEAEYLGRYLAIVDLIDRKMKSIPEERVVESLTVDYTGGDQQGKVALATELQERARGGKTLGEIAAAFPGRVRFSVIGFQELQGWIKDRIELLKDGEISVVWTKEGYMILRPVTKQRSYGAFEDDRPGRKSETRAFVRAWTEELKKEIREIEIIRARR